MARWHRARLLTATLLVSLVVGASTFAVRISSDLRYDRLNHALLNAVKANDLPAVEHALSLGADANARDDPPIGLRQCIWDVFTGRRRVPSRAPTALLIELQFRYVPYDDEGDTITRKVPPAFVDALLRHGADVDALDRNGHTSLWYALMARKGLLAQQLIDHGATVTAGPDPAELFNLAIGESWYIGNGIAVSMLKRGASVSRRYRKCTPLGIAVQANRPALVHLLLRRHADPNQLTDNYGEGMRSPLDIAIPENQPEVARILRAAGARHYKRRRF